MIKAIIFDYGRVLADVDFLSFAAECAGSENDGLHLYKATLATDAWRKYDAGIYNEKQILEVLKTQVAPEQINAMRRYVTKLDTAFTQNDSMLPVVKSLKEQGYKLYLLSNFPEGIFERVSARTPILDFLDGKVVSYKIKMTKPDREIYEYLMSTYLLKADECLFTDDTRKCIDGARAAGMNAELFTTADAFVKTLADYGIKYW